MKNPKIKVTETQLLSDNWYILNKVTFDYEMKDGKIDGIKTIRMCRIKLIFSV